MLAALDELRSKSYDLLDEANSNSFVVADDSFDHIDMLLDRVEKTAGTIRDATVEMAKAGVCAIGAAWSIADICAIAYPYVKYGFSLKTVIKQNPAAITLNMIGAVCGCIGTATAGKKLTKIQSHEKSEKLLDIFGDLLDQCEADLMDIRVILRDVRMRINEAEESEQEDPVAKTEEVLNELGPDGTKDIVSATDDELVEVHRQVMDEDEFKNVHPDEQYVKTRTEENPDAKGDK